MNAEEYKPILETVMVPYAEENMPLRWVFQQDNDQKHTSRLLSKFFEDQKVDVLKWPSQSPDLNPLKNKLGDLQKNWRSIHFQINKNYGKVSKNCGMRHQ